MAGPFAFFDRAFGKMDEAFAEMDKGFAAMPARKKVSKAILRQVRDAAATPERKGYRTTVAVHFDPGEWREILEALDQDTPNHG